MAVAALINTAASWLASAAVMAACALTATLGSLAFALRLRGRSAKQAGHVTVGVLHPYW